MKDLHNPLSAYRQIKAIKKNRKSIDKKYLMLLLLWHKQEKEEVESKE